MKYLCELQEAYLPCDECPLLSFCDKNSAEIVRDKILKDVEPTPEPTPEEMEEMYQEHLLEDAKDIEFELKKGGRYHGMDS